jgi:NADPH:quinone reductase-like Zn-dependent oxidoreductase
VFVSTAPPTRRRRTPRRLARARRAPWCGVVYLGSCAAPAAEVAPAAAAEQGCASVLALVQALARAAGRETPRLWLVTRGAQAVPPAAAPLALAQAPLWGLGRVIAHEHPELRCTRIDLPPVPAPPAALAAALATELGAADGEDEVALRAAGRFVLRLVRTAPPTPPALPPATPTLAAGRPFRLEIASPGILDHLTLRPTPRRPPGPGAVEIQVRAAGLNFRDVLTAMGLLPPLSRGRSTSAGSVRARSSRSVRCRALRSADDVMAVAPPCLAPYDTPRASWSASPSTSASSEAATIPIVFATAYYALHELARLRRGERVLNHAAAGGVGLAAIQLARLAGAEVFATAGSPEKRQFLASLGIAHVMDSRSLAFAEEVMARTHGEGVDVVLNSLAGEAIPRGLSTLRAHGRFLGSARQTS